MSDWTGPKLVGVASDVHGLRHEGAVWTKDDRDYLGPLCRQQDAKLADLGFAVIVTCIQCTGLRDR